MNCEEVEKRGEARFQTLHIGDDPVGEYHYSHSLRCLVGVDNTGMEQAFKGAEISSPASMFNVEICEILIISCRSIKKERRCFGKGLYTSTQHLTLTRLNSTYVVRC